jgi:serine protease inhibitor
MTLVFVIVTVSSFLTDPLQYGTLLVLVSAIHFKGLWEHPFDCNSTVSQDFYPNKDTAVKCQMMTRTHNFPYAEFHSLEARIIAMAYKVAIIMYSEYCF